MSAHDTTKRAVALLLAATIGEERSTEVVGQAAQRRGIGTEDISHAQALALLDDVASIEGIVGVAARFARQRLAARVSSDSDEPSRQPPPAARTHGSPSGVTRASLAPSTPQGVHRRQLASLMAPTLGLDKSTEIVNAVADRLQLGEELALDGALLVLETLAAESGLVGISARFAKARLILMLA
jgi:hypothetical protein